MRFDIQPVKKWFGYNRKERRASLILILLIVIVYLARFTVPEKSIDITDLTPSMQGALKNYYAGSNYTVRFDPNKAPLDTLIKAGLDEQEARTLISYRNSGGRFRKPSDIRRIYGLDSVKAEKLIPVIQITSSGAYDKRNDQPKTINLNRCDSAELEKLPGIGPVLAARIIKYRNLLGGYVQTDQLKEVYGLTPDTYELIRSRIFADTSEVVKININSADYRQLTRLPYLKRYQVTDILKYRELMGQIKNLPELVRNNLLTDSVAEKINPYVVF